MNRKFVSKSNRILRKVLNSEKNLDIIGDIIETFLDEQISQIKLNPYLEKYKNQLPSEEDFGIADVRLKLKNGTELNVGMQFIDGYYVQNKMLLYYAQIHSAQLLYNDNRKLAKTVTINFLDFEYLHSKQCISKVQIPSKEKSSKINNVEMYIVELPKFVVPSCLNNMNKKDGWLAFLCGNNKNAVDMAIKKFPNIQKLNSLLNEYWRNERML